MNIWSVYQVYFEYGLDKGFLMQNKQLTILALRTFVN